MKIYNHKFLLGFVGIIGLVVILLITKSEAPLADQATENEIRKAYGNEFSVKLEKTNFISDVLHGITEKGYDPSHTLGFIVESPENQIIAVWLKNIEKVDKKVARDIQEVVNLAAQNNGFHPFTVDIQLFEDTEH